MAVYPAKYVGLNAFERANAMANLPIGFEPLPPQKQVMATIGGQNIGTGQTTIEGARDYLANIPSGITGQGARFTPEQIDAALKGLTGHYQTRADAEADLRARMTAFTPEELEAERIGSYRGMLGQPRTGATPDPMASDNPLKALMDLISGVTQPTGTDVTGGLGGVGSFPISAPTTPVATIRSGQTSFTMDANGLRVVVPGKSAIRIPINSAGVYRPAIEAALLSAGLSRPDIDVVLADYANTRQGQLESPATLAGQNVTDAFASLFGGDATTGDATASAQDTALQNFMQIFGLDQSAATPGAIDVTIPGVDATPGDAGAGDFFSTFFGDPTAADAAGVPSEFAGIFDFFNQGEQTTTAPTFDEDTIKEFATQLADNPTEQTAIELFGAMFNNADEPAADFNVEDLITGTGGVDELLKQLGLPVNLPELKEIIQDPTATAVAFETLGTTKLNAFKELVRQAETKRQFDAAMKQFNQSLEVTKYGQQVTVMNKMMEMTMRSLELNQTTQNNLMEAQIAAMNTALKSQELSQAEQASIRSNMLDAVGLELEEKRINNEQANFLSTQLLAQADLALRVRSLDQAGDIAAADRELEREGLALTERLGLADIADRFLGRQAELTFGREGLAQERELGLAGINQRREEAAMNAQVALLNAAMANPYSFAALSSLGGLPGITGGAAPAAAAVSPTGMFPSLAGLGFQIPETAQAGTTTPAPAFFTGGMPTVGALGELDPASLAYLQNVLAFSGTPPEGLGRMAGAVTPAAGGFQGLGRTFFG